MLTEILTARIIEGNCDLAETAVKEMEFADKHAETLNAVEMTKSEAVEFIGNVVDKCTESYVAEELEEDKDEE